MPKLPSFDPIDYLVHRKHPKAISPIAARLNVGDGDVPSDQDRLRYQKAADAFRKELSSKTPAEINELVEVEIEKQRAEAVDREACEEAQRFYNLPSATADFDHYCKAAYWTLDECVALSFGKDPKQVNWESVRPHLRASPFAQRYEKLRDLTLRAKSVGQLFDRTLPSVYLAWAKEHKIALDDELLEHAVNSGISLKGWQNLYNEKNAQLADLHEQYSRQVEGLKKSLREAESQIEALQEQQSANQASEPASESEKSLGTKERDSLLKLVGGMAVRGYSFDPRQSRNDATSEIRDDLQALGLGMNDDTIRKYVKQGAELIPRDALENLKHKPSSVKR